MRITVLTTSTNNTPPFYRPLAADLGHNLSVIVYDVLSLADIKLLPTTVKNLDPEVVVYIGALEEYHNAPVPNLDVLREIGNEHLLVHFCCDGGEPVWWPTLERYYNDGRFALQVNIDGICTGPIGERGLTLLSPFSPRSYVRKPYTERSATLGFAGSNVASAHPRGRLLSNLGHSVIIRTRDDAEDSYYAFLSDCKAILNTPWTGSGQRTHVKGRVIECGLVESVLFDHKHSPTQFWFKPGEEYFVYESAYDINNALASIKDHPEDAQRVAAALHKRVIEEHSPEKFWGHVFFRLGLRPQLNPTPVIPFRNWRNEVIKEVLPRPVGAYNGYNLVAYQEYVWVVPQSLGEINLMLRAHRKRKDILRFPTLAAAKAHVGV